MKRYWIKDSLSPYFMTHTVVDWMNVFVNAGLNGIILDLFSYYRYKYEVEIFAYVIMPNHLHYIACFNQEKYGLSQFVRDFKAQISKKLYQRLRLMKNETSFPVDNIFSENNLKINNPKFLIRHFEKEGNRNNQQFKLWRDDECPVILGYEEMAIQRLNYLHENPVRKGWVTKPENYIYSSARYYENGDIFPFRVTHLIKNE